MPRALRPGGSAKAVTLRHLFGGLVEGHRRMQATSTGYTMRWLRRSVLLLILVLFPVLCGKTV